MEVSAGLLSGYKVLKITERERGDLEDPHYFGEYEAIVVEPTWKVLGFETTRTDRASAAELMIDRRSDELTVFFEKGGLLVVQLVPVERRLSYQGKNYLDNHVWWTRHLGLPARPEPLVGDGSGVSVEPVEPGHAFEPYLESATAYQARLARYITDSEHVTVLATNRAGEPVAAEVAVDAGSVVIVPPPTDHDHYELLWKSVEATLKTRFGLGFEWKLPEELELDKERTAILHELRDKRTNLDERRAKVQRIKAELFKTTEVKRALNYWREAIGPGATPKKAMVALYNMLEMFAGYFDTGWAEVARTLGVSHNSMKRIGELANRRTLNLRHATSGNPEDIDEDEYNRVLSEARDIVQAFITYVFRDTSKAVVGA